ncbi:alanine--glyoxylate aminotransferase 2, mitochondrial isoform X1 [Oopsacas minuta]|uniref:Alanine--glyoxylate aminotransferase 2, mitochondrial n=1 Tax=Oopsacas minuta TaxID=111878 RepID=A0AAV7JAP6_9METZ|nr:alanine--glyoxylate aminotransferase 2, mitochondrial isoform X1 [Oopsacas minuta]
MLRSFYVNAARYSYSTTSLQRVPKIPDAEISPKKVNLDYDHHLRIREKHLNPAIFPMFSKPLLITQGNKQYLWDHTGKQYIDLTASISTISVGHCHPKVTKHLKEAVDTLWHCTNMHIHPNMTRLLEKLTSKLPKHLDTIYLVNSGTEANEMALSLARLYTGAWEYLTLNNAYHGISNANLGMLGMGPWKPQIPNGFGITSVMNPDVYRGMWGGKNCRDGPAQTVRDCNCADGECMASENYLGVLDETFRHSLPPKIAGMMIEPIQGAGGGVHIPRGYMKGAFEMTRKRGGLCISDEVQTGFGRLGSHYWGFEYQGVMPDIVVTAKGMGSGFPIAAVITTKEIASCLARTLHFNTFGGNALSCAVASATLDVIDEENMQAHVHEVGNYLISGLLKLRERYEFLGDVRGIGFMVSIELATDKKSRNTFPANDLMKIMEDCRDMGVLVAKGGMYSSLRIKPPFPTTKQDMDFVLEVFDIAFNNHLQRKK